MNTRKLNDVKVSSIPLLQVGDGKFKGCDLFSEQYPNIFLLAKKKSGKTSTIFNILKNSVTKNTQVIIFSSTLNKDLNMLYIINWLEEKKIPTAAFMNIWDGKTNLLRLAAILNESKIPSIIKAKTKKILEEPKLYLLVDDCLQEKEICKKNRRHF